VSRAAGLPLVGSCHSFSQLVAPVWQWRLSSTLPGRGRQPAASIVPRMASHKDKTVPALKDELRKRGLPVSGNKAALIARLEEHDAGADEEEEEEEEVETEVKESKQPAAKKDDKEEEAKPEYGTKMHDPHKGKPEVIIDEEGRERWLCLDGNYRRGDPEAILCAPEYFSQWLSEWVVAARVGKTKGKPQMTFLPDTPHAPGNSKGTSQRAGREIRSEDILKKHEGPDGEPIWHIIAEGIRVPDKKKKKEKTKAKSS